MKLSQNREGVMVYVVGQYKHGEIPDVVWELQGVFSTKENANAACRTEDYFVVELTLDESLPHETMALPTRYFLQSDVTI